jgi:LAO/AO transport system kinase
MVSRTQPASSDIAGLARAIRSGDRATLARAITLVESKRADHRKSAHLLVQELLRDTGKAIRLGITGAPGAGKSTTIDALGTFLTAQGHKVAVLAVDPSSTRTGGSILGDKTRMAKLGQDPSAFIRPSPSSGTLGGVAAKTRETMLICEAAGFDVVLVETVGIGQSETTVADMIAVNKADGDNVARTKVAAADYRAALNILVPRSPNWKPPVTTYSALTGDGIAELWRQVTAHRAAMTKSGELAARRREQQVKWMWSMLEERLTARLRSDPAVRAKLRTAEAAVADGKLAPTLAVEEIAALIES